jgi:hypothetical protein
MRGRAIIVIAAMHALACVPGTPASSPDAFQIAAGTPVTLHMKRGYDVSGELAGDDERTVYLDSRRVAIAKVEVDTIETRGTYTPRETAVIDEYGHPTTGNKIERGPDAKERAVQAIVNAIFTFVPH